MKKLLKTNKIQKLNFYLLITTILFGIFSGYTYMNENFWIIHLENVKTSGFWILNPFTIDDNGFGNYTWSEAAMESWCDGSGTWNDPYIIENVTIDAGFSSDCLRIVNSSVFFIIRNCTLINAGNLYTGIYLYNVNNGTIIDSIISFNYYIGIVLSQSNNNTIQDNTINSNGFYGLHLNGSNNNKILGNIILKIS